MVPCVPPQAVGVFTIISVTAIIIIIIMMGVRVRIYVYTCMGMYTSGGFSIEEREEDPP